MNRLFKQYPNVTTYIISLLSVLLIYSPLLVIPFAQEDDYFYFGYDNRHSFTHHPQYAFFNVLGRPLCNAVGFFFAKLISTVNDFTLTRFLAMLLIAGLMTILIRYLQKLTVSFVLSFLIALAIFILPGIQFCLILGSASVLTLVLLLSLSASIVLNPADKIAQNTYSLFKKDNLIRSAITLVLLLTGLFFYPPWTMFFFVPLALFNIFGPVQSFKDRFIRLSKNVVVMGIAEISYFLYSKFIFIPKHHYYQKIISGCPIYTFSLTSNVGEKLGLLKLFSLMSSNLWSINFFAWRSLLIVAVIGIGGIVWLFQGTSLRSRLSEGLLNVGILIVIAGCMFMPSLLAAGGVTGYRICLPFTAMLVALLFWAILTIGKVLPSGRDSFSFLLIGIIVLCGAIAAFMNVRAAAFNNFLEFNFIKQAVLHRLATQSDLGKIHFVLPYQENNYFAPKSKNFLGSMSEFNFNSARNQGTMIIMLRGALVSIYGNDIREKIKPEDLKVSVSNKGEPVPKGDDVTVIDFTELQRPPSPRLRRG